ncbi:hypothetical protein CJF30_00009250 [Rutstroemia sp. NJR-2017a BBW]|nr:hypothetical protein CJF30_00009250 [Rutstroemia sp. NJR-2017a BBW]
MSAINPMHKDTERAFALQKYLLLHSQHDALQKHITAATSTIQSPAGSTERWERHRNASISSDSSSSDNELPFSPISPTTTRVPTAFQYVHRDNRTNSLPPVADESKAGEIEDTEMKLKNVNLQIKTTLTDLLNCESVRGDKRYRMWVQTRLMDTEKELRGSRARSCERRRSGDFSE